MGFQRDVLGVKHPRTGVLQHWAFQRRATSMLYKHRRLAITSSRSTGKTKWLGDIVPTFLYTEPSRVIMIGPTLQQIVRGAMSEARDAMAKSAQHLETSSGTTAQKEIRIDERHWAVCLASKNPDSLRGYHASPQVPGDPDADQLSGEDIAWLEEQGEDDSTRLLIVIDEAGSVGAEAYRVLRGMMTKPNVYVVLTGNPTLSADDDHDYVRAFSEDSNYYRIRVSSVSDDEVPTPEGIFYDEVFDHVPEYLVAPKEIASARKEYTKLDPIWISDWGGTFPSGASDWSVVTREILRAAVASEFKALRPLGPRIGVDIGTGKPDMCVASLFFDGVKVGEHVWAPAADDKAGQVTIADTIMSLAHEWGEALAEMQHPAGEGHSLTVWDGRPIPAGQVSVDDSGLVGVCDILASRGFFVDAVNFAKGPEGQWRDITGTQRFLNIRAEMHWVLRRGLQEGVFVIPTRWSQSWREAVWTRYERRFDDIGPLVRLEPKEKVKERNGGRSPDVNDADILACRKPTPAEQTVGQAGQPVLGKGRHSAQPIVGGRLRPTKLAGARKIR